jgi:hypothetical protein
MEFIHSGKFPESAQLVLTVETLTPLTDDEDLEDSGSGTEYLKRFTVLLWCTSVSQRGFRETLGVCRTSLGIPLQIVAQINENFEIQRKIPKIIPNNAKSFVRRLAILE